MATKHHDSMEVTDRLTDLETRITALEAKAESSPKQGAGGGSFTADDVTRIRAFMDKYGDPLPEKPTPLPAPPDVANTPNPMTPASNPQQWTDAEPHRY
jgi:hypothetical protein